jgi:hypothetical protein
VLEQQGDASTGGVLHQEGDLGLVARRQVRGSVEPATAMIFCATVSTNATRSSWSRGEPLHVTLGQRRHRCEEPRYFDSAETWE